MLSSSEDAIALFRKWQGDKAPVYAMLLASKVTVMAKNTLIGFHQEGFTLQAESRADHFLLEVPLAAVESYQYVTARDFWPELRRQTDAVIAGPDDDLNHGLILTMKDSDDVTVAFFEQVISNWVTTREAAQERPPVCRNC